MRILNEEISGKFILVTSLITLASLSFAFWAFSYSVLILMKTFEGW